jgi:hypothetical protein
MSDVRVIGLNMHTVLIEDIGIDVPHRVTVAVPGDKAARSKDLWRLIAQKQLFRLDPGFRHVPPVVAPPPIPGVDSETARLREENRLLAERNDLLHAEQDRIRSVLAGRLENQDGKLDAILGMLATVKATGGTVQAGSAPAATAKVSDVVDIEVPTFIPSEIKPKNVEAHIEIQSEKSEGSGVADAGAALRRLRKSRE